MPLIRPQVVLVGAVPTDAADNWGSATLAYAAPQVAVQARLGRVPRAVNSQLWPPGVVGAGVVFLPVAVSLAPGKRGQPRSRLFPPAVVNAPPAPTKDKLAASLTAVRSRNLRIRRAPNSVLWPPAVIGAGIVFRPVKVRLTPGRRPITNSVLWPPGVIGAGIVFRPVKVRLAPSRRPKAKSALRPPPVAGTPPFAPIRRSLTRVRLERRRATWKLFPPTVVGSTTVARPVQVTLAKAPRRRTRWLLRPPVIPALTAPIRVTLARATVRPVTRSRLGAPILPPLAPPVRVTLAARNTSRIRIRSILFGFVPTTPGPPIRVTLARSRRGTVMYELGAPHAVAGPPVVRETLVAALATVRRHLRVTMWRLGPPVIASLYGVVTGTDQAAAGNDMQDGQVGSAVGSTSAAMAQGRTTAHTPP